MRWKTVLNWKLMCAFIFRTLSPIISWHEMIRTWQKMLEVSKSTSHRRLWKTVFYTVYLAMLSHYLKSHPHLYSHLYDLQLAQEQQSLLCKSYCKHVIHIWPILHCFRILKSGEVKLWEQRKFLYSSKSCWVLLWVLSKVVGGGKAV